MMTTDLICSRTASISSNKTGTISKPIKSLLFEKRSRLFCILFDKT